MEEKRDESKPYNCFVAFLDIMGFKERLQRNGHGKVNKMFDSLLPTIEEIKKSLEKPRIKRTLKTPGEDDIISYPSAVTSVIFSDSIILITDDDSEISAMFLFHYVKRLLQKAFIDEVPVPLKGAIACGEMTAKPNKSIYFGQPLIDAFEFHKELKIYGVVLHYTCEKCLYELKNIEGKGIVQYPVPMKSGKITHYIVDWTEDLIKNEINPIDLVNKFYNNVSGKPRKYVDNTIEFLEWLKEEKAKKEQKKSP